MLIGSFLSIGGSQLPPPIAPGNPAQLAVWLDGFDINNGGPQPSDTDPLVTWSNKGNSGANFIPGSPVPTFAVSRINGHPAEVFANGYIHSAVNPNAANSARHLWAVLEITSGGQNWYSANDSQGYALNASTASTVVELDQSGSGQQVDMGAPPSAGNAILEISFDGNPAHLPVYKINGVIITLTNPPATPVGVGTEIFTNTLYLGRFQGAIGEFLDYTAVQTAGVAARNQTYLANKWGISV